MTLSLEWIDEREGGSGPREEAWIALLEKLLRIVGEAEGVDTGIVTLTLTDDDGIRELNEQYRGINESTDVLSFPMAETVNGELVPVMDGEFEWSEGEEGEWIDMPDGEDPFTELLGDIVISVPTAIMQAEKYGHSLERELGFLFVHGLLHLFGYDHEDEAGEQEMFAKQDAALAQAGLSR